MFNVIPVTGDVRYTKHSCEIIFRSAILVCEIEPKSDSAFVDAPSISDIQYFMVEEDVLTGWLFPLNWL